MTIFLQKKKKRHLWPGYPPTFQSPTKNQSFSSSPTSRIPTRQQPPSPSHLRSYPFLLYLSAKNFSVNLRHTHTYVTQTTLQPSRKCPSGFAPPALARAQGSTSRHAPRIRERERERGRLERKRDRAQAAIAHAPSARPHVLHAPGARPP